MTFSLYKYECLAIGEVAFMKGDLSERWSSTFGKILKGVGETGDFIVERAFSLLNYKMHRSHTLGIYIV